VRENSGPQNRVISDREAGDQKTIYSRVQSPSRRSCRLGKPVTEVAEELGIGRSILYGWVRTVALAADLCDQLVICAPARIRRLMTQRGLHAIQLKNFLPKTSDGRADRLSPNLLRGKPLPTALDDISFIPTSAGWLYLAVTSTFAADVRLEIFDNAKGTTAPIASTRPSGYQPSTNSRPGSNQQTKQQNGPKNQLHLAPHKWNENQRSSVSPQRNSELL
jgi:hypothetical protein